MFSSAEGALLTPVIFFDLFNRPLRVSELGQLAHGIVLSDEAIGTLLAQLISRGILIQTGEFVTLPGRVSIIEPWYERELSQRLLWAEAQAVISCLAGVPFVKLIAVVNSLALHTANQGSDIDLMIVVAPGWLAVARDHLLARLEILGRRAHKLPKQGKVFPDIILSTDRLELSSWCLEPSDIYLDYWLAMLQPVIDRDGTYGKLIGANSWLGNTFPNWQSRSQFLIVPDAVRERHRKSWELWYRSLPGKIMSAGQTVWHGQRMRKYKDKLGDTATVVITQGQLRIHEPDKRPLYQQKFEAQWQTLEQATNLIPALVEA